MDASVVVWNPHAGVALAECNGHTSPVVAVALSDDGKQAMSGGAGGVITVWNV
jgi:WD40 repeat protein